VSSAVSEPVGFVTKGAGIRPGRSFLSDAASLTASQVARRLFRMLFLLFSARVLGPESFGLYILLLTITDVLSLLSGGGFGDYLTREVARSPGSARSLFFRIIELHFGYRTILGVAAIAGLRLMKYSSSAVANAMFLLITLFPRGVVESSEGVMRGMQRLRPILWVELLQGSVLVVLGSLMLLRGYGLHGVILAELASALVGALMSLSIASHLAAKSKERVVRWYTLVRETIVFNLYPLITNTYDRADAVLLSKLVGNAVLGIYAIPYRLYAALSILPYGIMGTLLPSLSKSAWDDSERERCHLTMQVLYAGSLLLVLAVMLLARPAVLLVLGTNYRSSSVALEILVWATIPMFLNYALNIFLLARKREAVFLRTASVCTILNITGNLLLIPRYSYVAAAVMTIITELVLLAQNLVLIWKTLGYVPMPKRVVSNSIVFVLLLMATRVAGRFVSPVGIAAIVVFTVYLHFSGSLPWPGGHYDAGLRSAQG
jgi:O-antigen/teichoic acid export membrane protein